MFSLSPATVKTKAISCTQKLKTQADTYMPVHTFVPLALFTKGAKCKQLFSRGNEQNKYFWFQEDWKHFETLWAGHRQGKDQIA